MEPRSRRRSLSTYFFLVVFLVVFLDDFLAAFFAMALASPPFSCASLVIRKIRVNGFLRGVVDFERAIGPRGRRARRARRRENQCETIAPRAPGAREKSLSRARKKFSTGAVARAWGMKKRDRVGAKTDAKKRMRHRDTEAQRG